MWVGTNSVVVMAAIVRWALLCAGHIVMSVQLFKTYFEYPGVYLQSREVKCPPREGHTVSLETILQNSRKTLANLPRPLPQYQPQD